tara:strand:- start:57 stop:452 length:396 start_codon:yes stop_codon:yes gene_type:complete
VFFENQHETLEKLIAKSADLTNKPFIHSVVNAGTDSEHNSDELDFTAKILCRDTDGNRLAKYDLELELFRSNKDIVLVVSKLSFPDEPILWSGIKTFWMDSCSGKKCPSPSYGSRLENLATKVKTSIDLYL